MTDHVRNAQRSLPRPGATLRPVVETAPPRRRRRAVLLVGEPEDVAALRAHAAAHPDDRHLPVGCCLPVPAGRRRLDGLPVLGAWDEVADVAARSGVDTVVLIPPRRPAEHILRRVVLDAELSGAEVLLTAAVPQLGRVRVRLHRAWGLPLLQPVTRRGRRAKAVGDRLAAVLLLALLLPVLLLTAVVVLAGSPGPLLTREPRVGRHGSLFELRRFRTTHPGTGTPTPLGSFLRRSGLRELPQLLNVARGEMAIVGPRPTRPSELGPHARRRLLVRPGLTGLWQLDADASGPADVRYVEEWSLRLELLILTRTLRALGR